MNRNSNSQIHTQASARGAFSSDDAASVGSSNGEAAPRLSPPGVGPSGPRQAGEGVAEEEQRVVDAEWLQEREPPGGLPAAQLRVTLLAAGFVIGASGASVRELSQKTRTRIQSWTEKPTTTRAKYESGGGSGNDRNRRGVSRNQETTEKGKRNDVPTNPTRVFRVRGAPADVSLAAEIIREAVALYNALCEGKRRGEFVRRAQRVRDVDFSYQPPPKTAALACVGSVGASARLPATTEGDGRDSRAAFAPPRSVFSLPAGTDPAVVAAAAAAAAAASRAVAGAYARSGDGSFGSFGDLRSLSLAADFGSGPRSNSYGSANPGGFSPGASPNANAYVRGTPPYVTPTFPYQQPTRLHGLTAGSRGLNVSFDRTWSGGGDDGWSDPSTPAFARVGSNATLS